MNRTPPQDHAKAVAQMCDLLDAAACLAGVPLLALVAVREMSGEINPKAWKKEYGPRRDAIITRSLSYVFAQKDFTAIRSAINDLGGRGNTKAWQYLQTVYPDDLLFRRLIGEYTIPESDAINDLGTDFPTRELSLVIMELSTRSQGTGCRARTRKGVLRVLARLSNSQNRTESDTWKPTTSLRWRPRVPTG